ncbi:uncharacterized protein N7484_006760 [Penicillium longicatenatum]|uniref:uncharacterized protein n=1 Tax=Penicillium longicatenatum TaxID=1561947 RepID=UPI002547DBD5|nr:uncharacterized protein N7484_006760 [Penicillium longicatenatum]KAJ5644253.1 hypothetical protein N7484_006760 [Penicillium longicatenatum]
MINGSFCDRDNAQPYAPDLSDQASQYAPTPGYYNETLHSHFKFSPSPDRYPRAVPLPQSGPRKKPQDFLKSVGGHDKECDPDTKCLLAFGPEA